MQYSLLSKRAHMRFLAYTLLFGILASFAPTQTFAATLDATFEFHQHCLERDANDDEWIFGPIPSPGFVAETRNIDSVRCFDFTVKDPQTLQTNLLKVGDLLDIDIVVNNPSKQDINRVRAWLSYDANMLEGVSVEIHDTFSVRTPGEKDFSEDEGYVKLEASTDGSRVSDEKIIFARIQFRVKETNSIGTPITFYDVQPNGHSVIMTSENSEEMFIVQQEPGILLVLFDKDTSSSSSASSQSSETVENIFDTIPEAEPDIDPNACVRDSDCTNGTCEAGQCTMTVRLLPNGAICSEDAMCESGLCGSGICAPNITDTLTSDDQRTAFSLLQIQNLRVTTEGTSAFLAWDALLSSQLKAYTVYYGKTSGEYMQRRTIDKSETTLTLRSLEIGKRYYFAVRGLSENDEETAFSYEVSIVIGDPSSSSAPLSSGKNPVASIVQNQEMPGETGLPSVIVLLVILSGIIGTTFASRRQLAVLHHNPHE